MLSLQTHLDGLNDKSMRTATLAGVVSIPLTIVLSWRSVPDDVTIITGGTVAAGPLFFAGLVIGYVYGNRSTESRRAGVQTGLVGSIGTVVFYLLNASSTVLTESLTISAVAIVLTPIALIIGVGLSILVSVIGAIIGEWLYRKQQLIIARN